MPLIIRYKFLDKTQNRDIDRLVAMSNDFTKNTFLQKDAREEHNFLQLSRTQRTLRDSKTVRERHSRPKTHGFSIDK